jgi:hypothetical protein
MQTKTPLSKDEVTWQASVTVPVFGAVPQQRRSLFQIAAQGAIALRSFHPEAQSELKLAIDWYEYRKIMPGYQFALEVFAAVERDVTHSRPSRSHTFNPQADPRILGIRPCRNLSAKPAAQRSLKRYLNLQFG